MKSVAVVVGITGSAQAVRADGSSVKLIPGSQIAESDTISTGPGASVRIVFQDDAEITLGADTKIAVREFSYDPSGAESPAFWVDMAQGVVRSVSGKVVEQNPEAFKLSSPLGVAGIRGTTTLHEIHGDVEIHAVLELGQGHIVVVTTTDGRTVVISSSLQMVELHRDSLEPLLPKELSDDARHDFLNQLNTMDTMRDGSHGMYVYLIGSIEALSWLETTPYISRLGFLPETLAALPALAGESEIFWEAEALPALDTFIPGVTLYGTSGNDYLVGTDGDDWMHGYKGDDYIYAGLGKDTVFGGYGSYDTIIKPGVMVDGNHIYGDELVLGVGITGDDDIIRVQAEGGKGPGDMTGGVIYGDAETLEGGKGGNDTITVEGTMSGGVIYGDAESMFDVQYYDGSYWQWASGDGGNDTISVNVMTGGTIYGDAEWMFAEEIYIMGGDDTITVNVMNGGEIFGDARVIDGEDQLGRAGNDEIFIGTMNGGTIYGDAQTFMGDRLGSDYIQVDVFNGGTIYTGAASSIQSYTAADEVVISSVGGTGVKSIYGSAGVDRYTIGNTDLPSIVNTDGSVITIYDFEGNDKVDLSAFQSLADNGLHDDSRHIKCTDDNGNYMILILDGVGTSLADLQTQMQILFTT